MNNYRLIVLVMLFLTPFLQAGGVLKGMTGSDVIRRYKDLEEMAKKAKQQSTPENIQTLDQFGKAMANKWQAETIDFLNEWAFNGKVYEAYSVGEDELRGIDLKEQALISELIQAGFVTTAIDDNKVSFALKTYDTYILKLYGYID